MIRRSLLTAALILAGSVIAAPKVNAQSVDVPFTGSVGGACNVGEVTPGVLVGYDNTGMGGNPTMLSSGLSGGTPGLVSVSCNQDSEVTVSAPVQTGGPSFTPVMFYVRADSSFGSADRDHTGINSPLILPMTSTTQLEIQMDIDKGIALVPGVYEFVTTVNITPL